MTSAKPILRDDSKKAYYAFKTVYYTYLSESLNNMVTDSEI
jgi:hypothetical protein